MEITNYESDIIEKQITIPVKDSEEKPKCYNFDEAIDLAGELKTFPRVMKQLCVQF